MLQIADGKIQMTLDDAMNGVSGAHIAGDSELEDYLSKKLDAFMKLQSGAIDLELVSQDINPDDVSAGDYAKMQIEDSDKVPVISMPFSGESFVEKLVSAIREGQKNDKEDMELLKRAQAAETPALAIKRAAEYESRKVGYKPKLRVIQGYKSREPENQMYQSR